MNHPFKKSSFSAHHRLPLRAPIEFYERIISILPFHVKDMKLEDLIRTMEICQHKKLGSERLFNEFFFFYIEKKILKLSMKQYMRSLLILGDREYSEDPIFWIEYMWPYIYENKFSKGYAVGMLK